MGQALGLLSSGSGLKSQGSQSPKWCYLYFQRLFSQFSKTGTKQAHIFHILIFGIENENVKLRTEYLTAGCHVRSIPEIGCLDGENSLMGRCVLTENARFL